MTAFPRRAARLTVRFPRWPRWLSRAGLFAGGPVFLRWRAYHWPCVMVLPAAGRPRVYPAFVGLAKLQPAAKLTERRLQPVARNRALRQRMVRGKLGQRAFPRGGGARKNFAARRRAAWRNSRRHAQVLFLLDQLRSQLRLDTW